MQDLLAARRDALFKPVYRSPGSKVYEPFTTAPFVGIKKVLTRRPNYWTFVMATTRTSRTTPRNDLTYERARELLSYDPDTGLFAWNGSRRGQGTRPGVWFAGTATSSTGHQRIWVYGRFYQAHRLAWLLTYGRWPSEQIDHRNGDGRDNRLENLRECTAAENNQNRALSRANTSGFMGVSWCAIRQSWRAGIRLQGRLWHLGYHKNPEAAYEAYLDAKSRLHQFQPVPRHLIAEQQEAA
jgi:hypothetical protein